MAPEGLHVFQSGAVISPLWEPAAYVSTLPPEAVHEPVAISPREREPIEFYTERGFFLEHDTALTRVHAHRLQMEPEVCDHSAVSAQIARAQWIVHQSRWPHFRALPLAISSLDATRGDRAVVARDGLLEHHVRGHLKGKRDAVARLAPP